MSKLKRIKEIIRMFQSLFKRLYQLTPKPNERKFFKIII